MPGSVNFEISPTLTSSPTYLTKFYKDTTVVVGTTLVATDIVNSTKQSIPMWDGQVTYPLVTSKIRSVEVYLDSDSDDLLETMVPSVYLGTTAFPSLANMLPDTVYVRLDGTTIKVQAKQTIGNCDVIVVTD